MTMRSRLQQWDDMFDSSCYCLFFISCVQLQLCLGLAILDRHGHKQEGVESSRRRQMMILTTLSSVAAAPIPAKSYGSDDSIKYDDIESLETINWNAPKFRGLNTERMADAINDSIKETNLVSYRNGKTRIF